MRAPPKKRVRRPDPPSPTESTVHNPFATFRARLSSESAAQRCVPAQEASQSERHNDVYRRFYERLAPQGGKTNVGTASTDMVILEKSASGQLRELVARRGADLHASALDQLLEDRMEVDAHIEGFAKDVSAFLSSIDDMYAKLTTPLLEKPLPSGNSLSGAGAGRFAQLQQSLQEAETKLRQLAFDYDRCMKEEKVVWEELVQEHQSSTGLEVKRELSATERNMLEEFDKEAREIAAETAQTLDEIEAEYKHKLHAETMKMMQSIMAD